MELQNINFEFIAGTKNILADTLSRLIEFDESIKLPEEEPGYEFGYTLFEELPPARVTVIEEVIKSKTRATNHQDHSKSNTMILLQKILKSNCHLQTPG